MNNLKRILTALFFVPLILFVILYLSPLYTFFLITIVALFMMHEFWSMLEKNNFSPFKWLGYFLLIIILLIFFRYSEELINLIFIVPVSILLFSLLQKKGDFEKILIQSSLSILAIIYIGILSGYLIMLRTINSDENMGKKLLIFLIAVVWLCDTGAFYIGSWLGRHPLSLRISPKKTVEGAIGGIIFGIIGGLLAKAIFINNLNLVHCVIISFFISIISQTGDLAESLIKRSLKAKDSGSLLPGHGGFLDRMDGLIFSAPFMYLISKLLLK